MTPLGSIPRPALLLVLALAGCTQFPVRARHDPNADFTRLHTYGWLPLSEAEPADQRVLDRAIDARIRVAVDRELGAKGFRSAAGAAPDFLLNYRIASSPASDLHGNPRVAWGGWWAGWAGSSAAYESYDNGAFFIAVIDPQTKRMIWVGAAEARLLPHISLERQLGRVDAAVHRILERFPPR
jgi:Domain of unknown function (DUF4136)